MIQEASDQDGAEDGSPDNFDFLTGLSVSIRAAINDRVVEEEVAFLPDGDAQISTAARSYSLTAVNVDVLDYLQAPGVPAGT